MRILAVSILISLVCLSTVLTQPSQYSSTTVKTVTSDSLTLYSTTYGRPASSSRTFVCLPMMGHTRSSFSPLRDSLVAICKRTDSVNFNLPTFRIFDLRGHGRSIERGTVRLNYKTMPEAEFAKYPGDLEKALRGSTGLTLIGASIGANTAALVTETLKGVDRLVLLSPGMNYRGLEPADALMTFTGQILLVASSGDEYSYNSVRELASLNPDHSTLMIFDGDAHGTDIINDNPAAMRALVDWLMKD